MIKKTNTNVFFSITLFLFLVFSNLCFAQKKTTSPGIRLGFGPVLGIYSINTNHAINPSQKLSILFSFRKEIKCDQVYKNFFLVGVEYFIHGVNFKSYYFKPDSLQLYDKNFPYDYSLVINELSIPLQLKHSFKKENNSLVSPYIMIGYHLRYLLPGIVSVSQNGNLVKDDYADLKFRNGIITNKLNSALSASVGWQKNNINNSRGTFFMDLSFRYGLSQYYFEKNYAANSLYINSVHFVIQLGIKF